ncbi:hypothetical protein ES332_A11G223800v1 [Gossypium tomentosum]|uniref:Uncharacterized protein n=1 Tax=Gossypium tomentosum TaxID=34277 RepID=A0A5D2NDU2_GOSTO|nr:hypothetical protein ES332_A11G223800v1 [Gossypium tomentosum]
MDIEPLKGIFLIFLVARKPSSLPPIIFPIIRVLLSPEFSNGTFSRLTPSAEPFSLKTHTLIQIRVTLKFKTLFFNKISNLQSPLKFGQFSLSSFIKLLPKSSTPKWEPDLPFPLISTLFGKSSRELC